MSPTSRPANLRRRWSALTGGAALTVLLLPTAGTAVAAPTTAPPTQRTLPTPTATPAGRPSLPQLSISVDNGQSDVQPGDKLRYTIIVSNLGATTVQQLRLTQTLPTAATFTAADSSGRHRDGQVLWTVRVPAAGHAAVHVTLTAVPHPPADLLRLASVACAQTAMSGAPLVCSSDSDLLPAGAAAAARPAAPAPQPSSERVGAWQLLPYGLGAAVVLVAGLARTWFRRARRVEPAG